MITGYFDHEYYRSNEYFICSGMARLGHEVVLFASDKHPKWQHRENPETKLKTRKHDGFLIRRIFCGPEVGIVPLMPSLFLHLHRGEFDIIHAHDFFTLSSLQGAIEAANGKCRFVVTQHNDQLPASSVSRLLYLFESYNFGKYTLCRAKKIIALTVDIKLHLIRMGADGNKIEVLPNGVDTEIFSPRRKNYLEARWEITPPVILFVGRLVREKGIEHLFQAFSEVVREIPEAKLVIVGKGPLKQEMEVLKRKLALRNVFFLGALGNRFMPNIYVGCDVLVLPSVLEPFGNVVIEAMAAGKPVIGSYVGGIKDSVVHRVTGFHVQPCNSKQISRYLIELLEDYTLKKKLGENARERALKEYDRDLLLQKIERIYVD